MVHFMTRNTTQIVRKSFGAIAIAAGLVVLPACNDYNDTASEINPDEEETIEEVSEDPVDYLGESVTLAGQVEETYDPGVFQLEDEEFFGDETILVIAQNADMANPMSNDYVQVTGEVRELLVAEIEEDYALEVDPDLLTELEVEYEGKPVVIANYIEPISEEMAEEMDG